MGNVGDFAQLSCVVNRKSTVYLVVDREQSGFAKYFFKKSEMAASETSDSLDALRLQFFALRFFANAADKEQESGHADA